MLKPYEDKDFELVQSWITDADILFQFAGTDFAYPVTRKQFHNYRTRHPDRYFYIGLTTESIPFAFGEIIPQEDHSHRLGRILVGDPNLRGRGLGEYFIRLLVDECTRQFDSHSVDLYVWDENIAAVRCYEKVGFAYASEPPFALYNDGKKYMIRKMTLEVKSLK